MLDHVQSCKAEFNSNQKCSILNIDFEYMKVNMSYKH